jgi:hypothetical protein
MNASQNQKTRGTMKNQPPISKYQKFKAEDVRRSQVNLAQYNPRKIAGEAKARLHQGIDKFGLVETLVWNRRTGNLVSGHQRITDLDERHAGEDYVLTMSVIDVDERAEKKLNVLLNNKHAQGEWDESKLTDLLNSIERDLEGTGFAESDLSALLDEVDADLKKVTVQSPPKMAWVLIGVPLVQFATINEHVEAIAGVPGVLVETTVNDNEQKQNGSRNQNR